MTGNDIFEMAISLIDRRSQADETADSAENTDYLARSKDILNVLLPECYNASAGRDLERRVGRSVPPVITDMTADIKGIDEGVLRGVLPYGLAYHLILQEDPTTADYLRLKYEEAKAEMKREIPASFEPICSPYGGLEYGGFSRW